ncbi:MAG: hypothetical protein JXK08_09775 [Flavobacteriaceae bacterium]|nr:hypothetical protein [Flavobacteriaceae bacterium]
MSTSENFSEFKNNLEAESKLNREFEKKFVNCCTLLYQSGDVFEALNVEEILDNINKQSILLTTYKRSFVTEIEDNLLFLDIPKSKIYLTKVNTLLLNLKDTLLQREKDLKKKNSFALAIIDDNLLDNTVFMDNLNAVNEMKQRAVNYLIDQVQVNLGYYNPENAKKLKWIGKPSQLGFIVSSLVDLGYIEAPVRQNGDINYTQFAKLVKQTFDIDTSESTLSKYLNTDSEKGQEPMRKFEQYGFNIPHKNIVS